MIRLTNTNSQRLSLALVCSLTMLNTLPVAEESVGIALLTLMDTEERRFGTVDRTSGLINEFFVSLRSSWKVL